MIWKYFVVRDKIRYTFTMLRDTCQKYIDSVWYQYRQHWFCVISVLPHWFCVISVSPHWFCVISVSPTLILCDISIATLILCDISIATLILCDISIATLIAWTHRTLFSFTSPGTKRIVISNKQTLTFTCRLWILMWKTL